MSTLVSPVVANGVSACAISLFSFGMVTAPKKFLEGGEYQAPFFHADQLPERDNKLYYLVQFLGMLMFGGCVVPVIVDPGSQMLCYQTAFVHGLFFIHSLLFLLTPAYSSAKPPGCQSISQWCVNSVLAGAMFILSLLASLHDTPNYTEADNVIPYATANVAMLAFSSFFGLLFLLVPKYIISGFWTQEDQQQERRICGFPVLEITSTELWWARCTGLSILGLNAGFVADSNLAHPLYSKGSLAIISLLTLHNFHQIMYRPYKSISTKQLCMNWIPNIFMSIAMGVVLALACIQR